MGTVADQRDLVARDLGEVGHGGIDLESGQGKGLAAELLVDLVEVVRVDVGVAEGVDEVAGGQAGHVGDQVGQQGVARDVERDAQEQVGRPLVELARQPAAR